MSRRPRSKYRNRRHDGPGARRRMATLFALAFGWVGVHRFSLGHWQWGLAHIFLFVVSMSVADEWFGWDITPWVTLSALVGYYDAYRWWRMSDGEFADRYLEVDDGAGASPAAGAPVQGKYLSGRAAPHPRVLSAKARRGVLASAKTAHDAYDYQAAADFYEQALDLDLHDGESRVLAARAYALLEDREAAYRHLAKAVQLRATNLDLVADDPDFAWLRTQPDFAARRRAGFLVPPAAAAPTPPAPPPPPPPPPPSDERTVNANGAPGLPSPGANLLDDLERLAALRERGVLDETEFAREKARLLRG